MVMAEQTILSIRQRWLLGYIVGVLSACGPTAPSPAAVVSEWGGEHVHLTINTTSSTLEFDCARGTVDQSLVPDKNGRFAVSGTFVRGHGGPVRSDESADRHPARYAGVIRGKSMELTVTLTDSAETIGTFNLVQGTQGLLVRCL
jgi:hypothetical protein